MKASISTMRYLTQNYMTNSKDLLGCGLPELIRLATNRLGGLEGYEEYGRRFDGVVVARVVSCVRHENSDHLHVCLIDDGGVVKDVSRNEQGYVQVVCGASNVREGLIVAWIPPGVAVPSSLDEAEPFVLGAREIRGELSNGMLASPRELGMYDEHEGILEINETEVGAEHITPGIEFKKLYGLDDILIDIENKMFTHRPDCFGQLGLAREFAGIQGIGYRSPDWYKEPLQHAVISDLQVSTKCDIPTKVPRFMLQVVDKIAVKSSPVWLKAYLTRVGIRPINNVVDWSNYYMHLTAQPTHAFDYDKVKRLSDDEKVTIFPRMAKKGEKLTLLNGKEIELTEDDMVIACHGGPIALAGIMGGLDTEVDEQTKRIVIECATFDMYTIRRTSMRHGLFTDAVTRYTKGQSPLQNDRVLAKIVADMVECDGAVPGMVVDAVDCNNIDVAHDGVGDEVVVDTSFINVRLGTSLNEDEVIQILQNVEFGSDIKDDGIHFYPPFWRTDIQLKEDIVEEVGRLYGFDNIHLKLPSRTTKPAPKNQLNEYKTNLRNILSRAGANEILSYSFVHGDDLKKLGVVSPEKWCYHIRNAISPDLQYYRPNIISSLVTKVRPNIKSDRVRTDDNEFMLFEIGKVHIKDHLDSEKLPEEMERLAGIFVADDKTAQRKYHGSPFYMVKQYVELLVGSQAIYEPLEDGEYPIVVAYEPKRSAKLVVNGVTLGVVGEFKISVKKNFKLPAYSAGFELDIELLKQAVYPATYSPIGVFPKTQQDVTLTTATSFLDAKKWIEECLQQEKQTHAYEYRIHPRDVYQKEDDGACNYTFRIWLWHPQKTLTTTEVNTVMQKIIERK